MDIETYDKAKELEGKIRKDMMEILASIMHGTTTTTEFRDRIAKDAYEFIDLQKLLKKADPTDYYTSGQNS